MAGKNSTHIPALDAYPDLEDLHRAAEALGLIVAAFLDDDLLPLDALYTNPEPCRLVLTRHDDLYVMVKECHASRNFSAVRNHGALRRQKATRQITRLLSEFIPALLEFAENGGHTVWSLDAEETVVEESVQMHIASLGIPNVYGAPGVLLHELGRFSQDTILANRVNNIFVKGYHTFLVNTSGSGKTRLAFEGLCQNWGFYFVGAIDMNGIGSGDLQRLLSLHIESKTVVHSQDVEENIKITQRCLRRLLLCRLLVFSIFAEHIGTAVEHKKLWLLLQALPRAVYRSDIFSILMTQLFTADEDYTRDYTNYLLTKLRDLFGSEWHMFLVIDEAQTIFGQHAKAFRDRDGTHYPILREIIDGWDAELHHHEISFVTVGTQIPKSGFQGSRNVDRHRWCSNTGAFDDEGLHHKYISRYLPPPYVETRAGQAFLRLVWEWCRGRYRFTDALMATLLRDGFRSPHTLFNDYLEAGTGYRPRNNLEFVGSELNEVRAEIQISRIDCEALESTAGRPLASALQEALFQYSVTGKPLRPFSGDRVELVSGAFGRFLDGEMSQIVIDEPIMLVTAAKWFCTTLIPEDNVVNTPEHPQRESLLDILQLYPPISPRTFLASLVIHITHAFAQGHSVSRVFSFPHSAAPLWAKQKAEVVALYRPHGRQTWQHSVVKSWTTALATSPTSPEDLISWLSHADLDLPPFCLPSAGDPDLVCVLRLTEGTFVRIVLQASATAAIIPSSKLQEMIQDMDNSNLFAFEDPALHEHATAALQSLPASSSSAQRPSILRVIASFPAPAHLNKSTRGVAGLNTGLFKSLAATIPASEVLETMIEAVTSGKRNRKRSLVDSEPLEKAKRRRTSQTVPGASGTRRSTRVQR